MCVWMHRVGMGMLAQVDGWAFGQTGGQASMWVAQVVFPGDQGNDEKER